MTTIIGVRPLRERVLVDIYDDGSKPMRVGGKVFWSPADDRFGPDDIRHATTADNRHPGIRPRWAIVVGTSPEAEAAGIKVGQKVFLDTMKWTRGVVYDKVTRRKVWSIAAEDILGIDEDGFDEDERLMIEDRYPEHV